MPVTTTQIIAHACYLVSVVMFMMGIQRLSKVKTARSGNAMAAGAMLLAVVGQFIEVGATVETWTWIIAGLVVGGGIGSWLAIKRQFTEMPELVALFNGTGGLASTFVSLALYFLLGKQFEAVPVPELATSMTAVNGIALMLAIIIGSITFTGSLVAYGKLSDKWGWEIKILGKKLNQQIFLPQHQLISAGILVLALVLSGLAIWGASGGTLTFLLLFVTLLTLVHGVIFVLPIGGGDMPVVISLLNSCSGVAAAMAGFALDSPVLIVSGSMVGAAGLILTQIMCKAMNRSIGNVLFAKFSADDSGGGGGGEYVGVRSTDAETAGLMFQDAQSLIIVPGYGMAVAQAQHVVRELCDIMVARGCNVRFAIHPVAGRMPGHMNVLLAEANVPYDRMVEMEDINKDFKDTDIVLVIGANDVVNPAALTDEKSPIYGMPILLVTQARAVYTVKRSLRPGFAGIKNELFEAPNNEMVFGDAKAVIEELCKAVQEE